MDMDIANQLITFGFKMSQIETWFRREGNEGLKNILDVEIEEAFADVEVC